MSKANTKSNSGESGVVGVVLALFKPLVRFALRHGVMAPELSELLKTALLQVADEELSSRGEERNISRMSVLTGLTRREVKKLSERDPGAASSVNLLSRVIGHWSEHPDFCVRAGEPRVLGVRGDDSEFADLVRSVKSDISPYTVLFGLQQAQVVTIETDTIRLLRAAFVPKADLAAGAAMLGQDCADLINAVEENIFKSAAVPNLHLTTVFDNVCIDKLDQIRDWILDRGTTFQEEARDFIGKCDIDTNPRLHGKDGGSRVVVSAFSLVQPPNLHVGGEK